MDQKSLFLAGEGDAWFSRNDPNGLAHDPVLEGLQRLGIVPATVVEIGCGSGWRLEGLAREFGSRCFGIDPSEAAVNTARSSNVSLAVGTADRLPYESNFADVVVFGFCLYMADPVDHFKIAAEADRVLKDGGALCIHDFLPDRPRKNAYAHRAGMFTHKMDYSALFTRHPSYRLMLRIYREHARPFTFDGNESICCDFMFKRTDKAFASE